MHNGSDGKWILTHASLFSGIGAPELAAEWMGWNNVFHCEWEAFPRRVLEYYWPNSVSYGDITKTDFTIWRGRVDVLTGGFPCQPYSAAGKRLGKADSRHLWPEMLRAIREIQPRWVVGENVSGLINWSKGLVFEEVQADLESAGYSVIPFVLPACGVNAPHRRDRVWFVAHANICDDGRNTRENEGKSVKKWVQEQDEIRESFKSSEIFGPSPNTDGQSISTETERGREISSEKRQAIRNEHKAMGGTEDATNPGRKRQEERQEQPMGADKFCEEQSSPDTESNGNRGRLRGVETENDRQRKSEERGENNVQFRDDGKEWHVADTDSGRPPREKHGEDKSGLFAKKDTGEWWTDFPTQPPVRGGNDGLPTKLDGTTFPKWRNESIKAYGNAMVPQVIYQIFKAIEAYEDKYSRH